MADNKHKRPVMAILITSLGIAGTAAYVGFLVWLTKDRWHWLASPTTDLNALGDFLAGAFGPLAIWWLVLGYFQQGIELRQNSEALRQQAEELRQSVAEQRKLAETAQLQLETHKSELEYQKAQAAALVDQQKKRAQPRLKIEHLNIFSDATVSVFTVRIANNGSVPCTDFKLHFEPPDLPSIHADKIEPGKPAEANIRLTKAHLNTGGFRAWAVFHDGNGDLGMINFQAVLPSPTRMTFEEKPVDSGS